MSTEPISTPAPDQASADADKDLVEALILGDNDAWERIHRDVVLPLYRANIKGIATQCQRHGLDVDAVWSRLYLNLSRDDFAPLRAFRFGCAFRNWLYFHVWNAAQSAIREVVRGPEVPFPEDAPELPDLANLQTRAAEPPAASAGVSGAHPNRLLRRLWEANPLYALVLVLRHDVELSAKETAVLLGKSSANVDQLNHRAQAKMRQFRDDALAAAP